MIINGRFIADSAYEFYLSASYDRRRWGAFHRHVDRFQFRVLDRRVDGFSPAEHASVIWSPWAGRLRIRKGST